MAIPCAEALKADIIQSMQAAVYEEQEQISNARHALGCLHDVLCHVTQDNLHCLEPAHIAGFLRLVMTQLPD
jgi:hypothetical protein